MSSTVPGARDSWTVPNFERLLRQDVEESEQKLRKWKD